MRLRELARRWRRLLAVILALALPAFPAQANGDGDLCLGPVNAVFCAGLLALKALTPATRAERMASAVERVDLDTLRGMKNLYPTEFDAPDLLTLAAGRYVARDFPGVPVARQREMLDFLIDAAGPMSSPAIAERIGRLASSDRPEARELLDNLFARGATARDVVFAYRHQCASRTDAACGALPLLLDHGLDPNRHDRFERPLLREALERGHFIDAQALLDHGANSDLEDPASESSGLVDLLVACPPTPIGSARDRECWSRTSSALVFLTAHGAHVDSVPAASVACWTLYDQADVTSDAAGLALLKSLHADPAAGDRCRARARQAREAAAGR